MIRDEIYLDEEEKLKILNEEGELKNKSKTSFSKRFKPVNNSIYYFIIIGNANNVE